MPDRPSQADTITFLEAIGCQAQAGDIASVRFAQKVIGAERDRIATWLREAGSDDGHILFLSDIIMDGGHAAVEPHHYRRPR